VKSAAAKAMTNRGLEFDATRTADRQRAQGSGDGETRELLRRAGTGQLLRLADYVRAEEALGGSAPRQANDVRAALSLRLRKRLVRAAADAAAASGPKGE
jgi:hypothetical protein